MTPLLWFLLGALVALPLARLWARIEFEDDRQRARQGVITPPVRRGPQAPNIRGKRDDHRRFCTQPQHGGDWGRYGDVRRCEHGRIMLGVERPGTIPPLWRDLDPLFDWRRYQRAQAALAVDPGPEHPAPCPTREAPRPPRADGRDDSPRRRRWWHRSS